ncbi:MAG TPA: PEGA domain-containing protein [Candidatus Portnoybacteria bacterium]|nr:PEGA domain-containing protein [Candidatus Portnoybacteria bacterium]
MSLKKRQILLLVCVIVFLVFSPLVIFYALGYKYSWQESRWLKTGAFYFQTNPSEAKIFIDKKNRGETSKLVDYLLPGLHSIALKKDNHQIWQKKLIIKPELVTNISRLVLPLELINISRTNKNNFLSAIDLPDSSFYFQTSTKIIYQNKNGFKKQYSIKLFPESIQDCQIIASKNHLIVISKKGNLYLLENRKFIKIASGVVKAQFASNDSKFLWQNKNEIWVYYFKNNFSQSINEEENEKLIIRLSQPIKQSIWLSPWGQQIFFLADKSVRLVELNSRGGTNIFTLRFNPYIQIEKIYWDSGSKYLYLLDQNGQWWKGRVW